MSGQPPSIILGLSDLSQSSDHPWLPLLREAGYTLVSLAQETHAPELDLLLVTANDSVTALEARLKALCGKTRAYLFIECEQPVKEHPEAGLYLIQGNLSPIEVVYKVESIVGLPWISEEVAPQADPAIEAKHSALVQELERLKQAQAQAAAAAQQQVQTLAQEHQAALQKAQHDLAELKRAEASRSARLQALLKELSSLYV